MVQLQRREAKHLLSRSSVPSFLKTIVRYYGLAYVVFCMIGAPRAQACPYLVPHREPCWPQTSAVRMCRASLQTCCAF